MPGNCDAGGHDDELTLGQFLHAGGFSRYFAAHFALPLVAAVWSCPPGTALQYPARHLFTFLANHGMLSVSGSPAWHTVAGGSRGYVERIAQQIPAVKTSAPSVTAIEDAVAGTGRLRVAERADFGAHYAETLRIWRDRFTGRAAEVRQLGFDEVFIAMWTYLCYAEAGFRTGYLDVCQLTLAGFVFESAGDGQLARFKADPAHRGVIMDRGLWRYTRHPNYFGDACMWWGLFAMSAGSWLGLAAVVSPLLMTYVLVRGTGQRLTDQQMAGRPGYAEYMERTSGFFPLPPRRSGGDGVCR